jgi:polyhydroxyalkanoate synthesis repressor PhaR
LGKAPEGHPYNVLHRISAVVPPSRRAGVSPVQSKKPGAAKPAQRVIKKYPNRRLYDTDTSTYITLAEVKQLVMDNEPFTVRDAKTNEDLTRSILLQIILEAEAGGEPMFSEAALANIIRFYGHAMQGFMGSYLEKNVQAFTDMQAKIAEQSKNATPEMWAQFMSMQNPMMQGLMGSYVEQSKTMFDKMQEQMQKQTEQMLGAFGIKK